jgi:hypothetical protein
MVKNHKSKNNENVAKALQINDQIQHQKKGKNTVKSLKHIHTVEVTGSNPVPPTNNSRGLRAHMLVNPFFMVA